MEIVKPLSPAGIIRDIARRLNFISQPFQLRGRKPRVDFFQHPESGGPVSAMNDKPAWAFRKAYAEKGVDQCWNAMTANIHCQSLSPDP